MKLILARHGESLANTRRVIDNHPPGFGLTDRGRAEALRLAERIGPIEAIYTSPLLRALETAAIVGKHRGIEPIVDGALIEYDCGILEGRSDPDAWIEHAETRIRWYTYGDESYAPRGGESRRDIRQRMETFLERVVSEHDGAVLAVSHGGTIRAGIPEGLMYRTPILDHTGYLVLLLDIYS